MDNNTLFFIAGVSAAGKSTRIYAFVKFLEAKGITPTKYVSGPATGKTIGREYFGSLIILGKEITKNGNTHWQGLDGIMKDIDADAANEPLYDYFFEVSKTHSLIVDSATKFTTHRWRPTEVEKAGVEANVYLRYYWYPTFEAFKERLSIRNPNRDILETDSTWTRGSSFYRYGEIFEEEKQKVEHPERFEFFKGDHEEPVWSIGVDVLKRIGREDLVDSFTEFANSFLQNNKKIVVEEESLF